MGTGFNTDAEARLPLERSTLGGEVDGGQPPGSDGLKGWMGEGEETHGEVEWALSGAESAETGGLDVSAFSFGFFPSALSLSNMDTGEAERTGSLV